MTFDLKTFANAFFEPLIAASRSQSDMTALLKELGITIELNATQRSIIEDTLDLTTLVQELIDALALVADGEISESDAAALTEAIVSVAASVKALEMPSADDLLEFPDPFGTEQFWIDLGPAIAEYLLLTWMEGYLSPVYEGLHFAGVIEETPATPTTPLIRDLRLDRLGELLSNPGQRLADHYGWGSELSHSLFQVNLLRLLDSLGVYPDLGPLRSSLAPLLLGPNASGGYLEMGLTPSSLGTLVPGLDADLVLVPFAPDQDEVVTGMALALATQAAVAGAITSIAPWRLDFSASGRFALGLGISPSGAEAMAGGGAANFDLGLSYAADQPLTLIGKAGGTRIDLHSLALELSAAFSDQTPALGAAARLGSASNPGLKIVISPGDGDSFIANVMGDQALEIDLGLGVAWESGGSLIVEGGVGFEVEIPIDKTLGPVRIDRLDLGLWGGAEGVDLEAAVTGGLDLSVIQASVEEIGIAANLAPRTGPGEEGNLGPLHLSFAFKPPKGLGLAINAGGIVVGGGYLFCDPEAGEYAGVGEVAFTTFRLTAIGMLNTGLPDIPAGWSLFLSVFSEFPPLQLGFGITLNGVGGMVGLHRTFDDEALRERLLDGALESILFPDNPVANAPRILDDLRAVFPPAPGQFVFGAMLRLGWGTPTLVVIDLGVIVELPDPIKIALLGRIGVALPTADAAIIELNMDVFGVANITEGTLALDATLRDSHVLHIFTLSGDMALRASFGPQPSFLMSMGGFHPDFTPPAGTPDLRRLKAALPLDDMAAVELKCYVAVTSNTFQTGGRVEVWVRVAGFDAEGWFGFDALIQFSPFAFEFRAVFGVSVSKGSTTLLGVDVVALVTGPGLWTVDGHAEFKFLGVKKKIQVDIEVGQERQVPQVSYDVAALLEEALALDEAWRPVAAAMPPPIILIDQGADGAPPVLPSDRIMFTQKVAPLGVLLEKFGNGLVGGETDLFDLTATSLDGVQSEDEDIELVEDFFAPTHFFAMNDADKLSAPSFQPMTAGAIFGSEDSLLGPGIDNAATYEEITLDPELNSAREQRRQAPPVNPAISAQRVVPTTKAKPVFSLRPSSRATVFPKGDG